MRCSAVRRLLSPYMDDDLDPVERDAVSRHLEVCRVCSAELGEYQRIRDRLRGVADSRPEMPGDSGYFWQGVKRRLDAPPAKIVRFPVLLRVIGASAAAAIVILGIVVAALHGSADGPTVAEKGAPAGGSGLIAKSTAGNPADVATASGAAGASSLKTPLTVTPVGGNGDWEGAEEEPAQQEKLITF